MAVPKLSFTLQPDAHGILPDRMIAAMADAGLILPAYPFVESQIQPASLDLRLGDIAYRVRASFLPGPDCDGRRAYRRVEAARDQLVSDGAVLETNCVYIVPLLERPRAAAGQIVAAANPKSSTGRLDVFTRVIADGTQPLRHDRRGLSRPALCRDQPEDVSGAVARGLAALPGTLPHRRRHPQRR